MKIMVKTSYPNIRLASKDEAAATVLPTTMTDVKPEAAKKVPTALTAPHITERVAGVKATIKATTATAAAITNKTFSSVCHHGLSGSKSTSIPISLCPIITSCKIVFAPVT